MPLVQRKMNLLAQLEFGFLINLLVNGKVWISDLLSDIGAVYLQFRVEIAQFNYLTG